MEIGLVSLAMLGFIGWLGGGRIWAFRTMLSALILTALGVAGTMLYVYGTDKVAEHRTQRIHNCAIAKVATAKCTATAPGNILTFDVCPPYWLPDNPTTEQEDAAIAAAEDQCIGEIDPKQKSLHEQISQYKSERGIVQEANKNNSGGSPEDNRVPIPQGAVIGSAKPSGDVFDQVAAESRAKKRLNSKACAAKVRTFYPGDYDDLDDATLTKKVLAKYPTYCDVTSSPPDFIPAIKDIR